MKKMHDDIHSFHVTLQFDEKLSEQRQQSKQKKSFFPFCLTLYEIDIAIDFGRHIFVDSLFFCSCVSVYMCGSLAMAMKMEMKRTQFDYMV